MNFPKSLTSRKRLPCLDGWRCLSIILVLITHSETVQGYDQSWNHWVRWLPTGRFGVEVFFVISGFLITYLLLREKEKSQNISLKNFYIRRALRILPAYAAFLIALAILSTQTTLNISGFEWLRLLTLTIIDARPPFIHIWSLSIEEQFYLIWPFLLGGLLARQDSRKRVLAVISTSLLIGPIVRVFGYLHPDFILFHKRSFLTCFDSMGTGCLLAVILAYHGPQVESLTKKYPKLLCLIGLSLIIGPIIATRLMILNFLTIPLSVTCNAIGVALLILTSLVCPKMPCFRFLEWKPVTIIGAASYSIYLWQELFCTPISTYGLKEAPWFLTLPYWIPATLVTAFLSYRIIERPFINLKTFLTHHPGIPKP